LTGFFFSPEGGFIEDSCPSLTTEYFFRYILNSAAPVLFVNVLEAQGRFFVSGLIWPQHKNNIS
jgi:hypothetical protein